MLRPRILVFGALLAVLVAGWSWGIATRSPLIAEVLRDRNALYRVSGDSIENGYTLKLANKTERDQAYVVSLAPAGELVLRGGSQTVSARAGEVLSLPLVVVAPEGIHGKHPVRFVVETTDGAARETVDSNFFGPM